MATDIKSIYTENTYINSVFAKYIWIRLTNIKNAIIKIIMLEIFLI